MHLLYLIALIPVFIGLMLFIFTRKVAWVEWILGSAVSFAVAGMFHGLAIHYMTKDVETWSGEILCARHYPEWVEEYQQIHFTYDSKGRITGTYFTTEHTTHHEYWTKESNIDTCYSIEQGEYESIKDKFGGVVDVTQPHKSGFDGGDKNLYTVYNHTGFVFPVTKLVDFTNRVRASPTLFSFPRIPADIDKKLFEYPENKDHFRSDRLMGTALNVMDVEAFDILNAKTGYSKHANVIMIGFLNEGPEIAEWQRAKWTGGKKNDVVICYGVKSDAKKAEWCRVFGWTEKEIVKRNLENIVMANPINNVLLVKLREEICHNYVIKDWKKFDYITIEPSSGIIIWMICIMILTQTGFYIFAMKNDIDTWQDLVEHFRGY